MKKLTWILLGVLVQMVMFGQRSKEISREEYISTFASVAMREMSRVGIPASITLAQGCLESNNGNSRLAVVANNHFGIKCHEWDGKKIYHDDDRRNECFRVYASPYESFLDHSTFLADRNRYAFLFDLDPDDYKGWARGLKKAGYATANNYASLLINIIEENELHRYDLLVLEGDYKEGEVPASHPARGATAAATREIKLNNNIEYVLVEPGDTPESLRNELDLYKNELFRYNELDSDAELKAGQIIYLQPKRRKAAAGNEIHVVEKGQTLYDISQIYGIKLKHLYKRNQLLEGQQVPEGTQIYLRNNRKEPILKLDPLEEERDEEEMQFQFDN
jgi:LysM repeat protein